MKSAIELAMERANAALGGEKIALTPAQKAAIEAVRKKYEARWAEHEIAFGARLQALATEPDPRQRAEARAQLKAELARIRESLAAERDAQLEAIRRGEQR